MRVKGRVGWSACENMMSGVVIVDGNAGSLTAAAIRGGDVLVRGRVGARTGIDQKGGTVIVLGDAGSMTGFMMQRGRQIILGDVGPGLGDSMYDGELYVGGKVKALGVDCVPGEWTDADTELIRRKFAIYELGEPPELQKFVCGKRLYNYDNLEPSERKLVLRQEHRTMAEPPAQTWAHPPRGPPQSPPWLTRRRRHSATCSGVRRSLRPR